MGKELMKIIFIVGCLLVLQWFVVDYFVSQPYMDEFFHFRQTMTWCEGRWNEWDPKITTLPGLYDLNFLKFNRILTCISSLFCVSDISHFFFSLPPFALSWMIDPYVLYH